MNIKTLYPSLNYVYGLRLSDGWYYVGITYNLFHIMMEHQLGFYPFTQKRRPVELVSAVGCRNRDDADRLAFTFRRHKSAKFDFIFGSMKWDQILFRLTDDQLDMVTQKVREWEDRARGVLLEGSTRRVRRTLYESWESIDFRFDLPVGAVWKEERS